MRAGLTWIPTAPDESGATPRMGAWQDYVLTPSQRSVCAPRVAPIVGGGTIKNAGALTCVGAASNVAATLARSGPNDRPRLLFDFGREMSGRLRLVISSGSTAGTHLRIEFSESLAELSGSCDRLGVESFAPANVHLPACPRDVAVDGSQHVYTDPTPRSGFRYVLISLAPGNGRASVGLDEVGLPDFTPMPQAASLAASSVYKGWFLSSDDGLNRFWYDGAYNAQVDTVAADDVGALYEGATGLSGRMPLMVDGAKRDRYVWYDLAGPKMLIPLLYGDSETPRDSLQALGTQQTAKGFSRLAAFLVPSTVRRARLRGLMRPVGG